MLKEKKEKILSQVDFVECEIDDVKGISDLINEMNPEPTDYLKIRSRSPEYYKWMYFNNPAGKAIVFCAKYKDKIISTFAMAPKKFYFFGSEVIIAKTMDIFTHPDYQGLGLMSKLAKLVFDKTRERMTQMWYVTPSVNSYPIFKNKWQYKEAIRVHFYLNVLDPKPFLTEYLKNPFLKGALYLPAVCYKKIYGILNTKIIAGMKHLDSFDGVESLWSNMKQHQKISIIKNTEYLKWRYIENPDQYEIIGIEDTSGLEGIVVLKSTIRKGLKIGEIIDMLYLNDDLLIVKKLLKASLSYFREKNCVAVQSLAIKGTELERCYKKNGFFQRREIKFLFSPEALDERFYSPCDWYLTQGDGNDI